MTKVKRSKVKRSKIKRTMRRGLKRRSFKNTKRTKINRRKKRTKRMKGGMEAQVGAAGGAAAGAAPTELPLKPIGEELKGIVNERSKGDDFDKRVKNRTDFFDKARELLQSASTITIDYEKHFTPEFNKLLAEHPDVEFSSLSEFEKFKAMEMPGINCYKGIIEELLGLSETREVKGVYLTDTSAYESRILLNKEKQEEEDYHTSIESVFTHWYYSILGFKYGIAAEPKNIYLAKVGEMYLIFFEYKKYPNFEDLLIHPGSEFKPLIPLISAEELEEANKYSISLTRSWLKHIKPTMDSLSICHRDNHYPNWVYDTGNGMWIMIDWDTAEEVEEIPSGVCGDKWPPPIGWGSMGEYFQFIIDKLDTMSEEELLASVKEYLGKNL